MRVDEQIVISRQNLTSLVKELPENMVPILKNESDQLIPSQVDDLDNDGKWDELFFLATADPNSKSKIIVEFVEPEKVPSYEVRSNIRFADMAPEHNELTNAPRLKSTDSPNSQKYFQMEGPAWENDKVGFRNYYDARNGMDIFGKRTPEMVLDKVGLIAHSYHKLSDWGMDILKVGNSLGSGAIAMKMNDAIYRLDLPETGSIEIVADGPLRSIFRMKYDNWVVEENSYDVIHEISIWGGANFYKSSVTIKGLVGGESLISGIVNIDSDSLIFVEPNEHYVYAATHDNQAYDGEKLGLGILLKKADFIRTITAPDKGEGIVQTYMVEMKIEDSAPVDFYFYAGWELQDEKFKDAGNFINLLARDANQLNNPLQVKLSE